MLWSSSKQFDNFQNSLAEIALILVHLLPQRCSLCMKLEQSHFGDKKLQHICNLRNRFKALGFNPMVTNSSPLMVIRGLPSC